MELIPQNRGRKVWAKQLYYFLIALIIFDDPVCFEGKKKKF